MPHYFQRHKYQLLMTLFLCLFAGRVSAETPGMSEEKLAGKNPTQIMMQNKLNQMNDLFSAVIAGDLDQARKASQLLQTISRASELQNHKDKAFASHALTFQNSAEYMLEQIKEDNRDGVVLGYVRLAMSCSYCHGSVRDVKPTPMNKNQKK